MEDRVMEIHIPQMSMGGGENRSEAQIYTVRPGDTLDGIATKFGIDLDKLIAANFKGGSPVGISPGQELKIPIEGDPAGFILYTVKSGDTLESIASQFDIGLNILFQSNPNLLDGSLIPGSMLSVPQFSGDSPQTHLHDSCTMRLGETLSAIAESRNIPLETLEKNNPHIADPLKSYPGAEVILRSYAGRDERQASEKGMSDSSSVGQFAMDNLSKIRFQMDAKLSAQPPIPAFGTPTPSERKLEETNEDRKRDDDGKPIPPPFDEWAVHIYAAAEKHRLDAALLAAIIWRESGGCNVVNGHKHGLMQIDGRLYSDWLKRHQMGLDPKSNIDFGAEHLRRCLDRFPSSLKAAVAAYGSSIQTIEQALAQGISIDSISSARDYAFDVFSKQDYFRKYF